MFKVTIENVMEEKIHGKCVLEIRNKIYAGEELAIVTPVSTGVSSYPSPSGNFNIKERKRSHRSSLYGDYVDANGKVVKRDVSTKNSSPPEGTHFRGTSMPYWQRLTGYGVGMHIGYVPGAPASHGCLRFPSKVMPKIYTKTRLGTLVTIE